MRTPVAVVLIALVTAGCGAEAVPDRPPRANPPAAASGDYRLCKAKRGTATDVAHEPEWREYADYRPWTTKDGCLVRVDVLADRNGPEHCGYESARVIITGTPVGTRYSDAGDAAEYVRDPDNVFGDPVTASAFDPDAELPKGAVDTGFRQGATALWTDPSDPSAIYLVTHESVERWPRDPTPTVCA